MDAKRIALSFEDAPNSDDQYCSGGVRTSTLIDGLAAAGVEQAMVCGVGNKIDDSGLARFREYGAAGHVLGNHTFDHCDASKVEARVFLDSLRRADSVLRSLTNFTPHFRFPFSMRRRHARKTRRNPLWHQSARLPRRLRHRADNRLVIAGRALSCALGIEVDSSAAAPRALRRDRSETASFYDELATRTLDQSPAHVLLLQENDVAALFVGDLIARLRSDGWHIVRVTDAYADALSAIEPDTLTSSHGRVSAVARDRGYRGPLQCPWEDTAVVQREIERRGVW